MDLLAWSLASNTVLFEAVNSRMVVCLVIRHSLLHKYHSCSAAQASSYQAVVCERRIPPKDIVQTLAVAYWMFHYAKRIFETFFVHRRAPPCSA